MATRRLQGARWPLVLLLPWLGCSTELEIKGNTERVIGEKVTIELLQGDPTLSGRVNLRDAQGRVYENEALNILHPDDRNLSFVIPPGIAQGAAIAELSKSGESGVYSLPISISRLAVGVHADGSVEIIPLLPKPLTNQTFPASTSMGSSREVAISPLSALTATLIGDELAFHFLGKEVQHVAAVVAAEGKLAALPSGALVATPSSLHVFTHIPGKGTSDAGSLTFPAGEIVRAVATSADGDWAMVLTSCSSTAEGDCLVQIDLRGTTPTRGAEVRLDNVVSATQLSLRADGSGALIPDGPILHGVTFIGTTAELSDIAWDGAEPSSVAHTRAIINEQPSDLFAVAAKGVNAVRMMGFKNNILLGIRDAEIKLNFAPDHISFGAGTNLYILSGQTLYSANAASSATPTPLATAPSGPLERFAVQP
ncbi:MAG: hypothetical protein JRH20_10975 [Deltaproteobacteria bacterium]|nr:hypothetical protein [Deltaproteobacteria bacterium]